MCKSGTMLHRADSAFCVTEDQCGKDFMGGINFFITNHFCWILQAHFNHILYVNLVVCTDNDGNPRAPGDVWNGSLRGCCLFQCLENGSVVPVEPECSPEPAPSCERVGEYSVAVLEEGACCPKKICGSTHLYPHTYLLITKDYNAQILQSCTAT